MYFQRFPYFTKNAILFYFISLLFIFCLSLFSCFPKIQTNFSGIFFVCVLSQWIVTTVLIFFFLQLFRLLKAWLNFYFTTVFLFLFLFRSLFNYSNFTPVHIFLFFILCFKSDFWIGLILIVF
jgi:hypothetical protein